MFFSLKKKVSVEGYQKSERKQLFTDIRNLLKKDYNTRTEIKSISFSRARTRVGTSMGAVSHTGLHGWIEIDREVTMATAHVKNLGNLMGFILCIAIGTAAIFFNKTSSGPLVVGILYAAAVLNWVLFYFSAKKMMDEIIGLMDGLQKGLEPKEASTIEKIKQHITG